MLDLEGREPPKYDVVAGARRARPDRPARAAARLLPLDRADRARRRCRRTGRRARTGRTPTPPTRCSARGTALVDSSRIEDGLLIELVDKALDAHAQAQGARRGARPARPRRWTTTPSRAPSCAARPSSPRQRRDEAVGRAQEAEGARDRALAEAQRLRERVAALEAQLATEQPEAAAPPPDFDDWLQGFEQQLAAQAATEAARDELHTRLEQLATERERDRHTIAELSRLLAAADTETDGAARPETAAEEPPRRCSRRSSAPRRRPSTCASRRARSRRRRTPRSAARASCSRRCASSTGWRAGSRPATWACRSRRPRAEHGHHPVQAERQRARAHALREGLHVHLRRPRSCWSARTSAWDRARARRSSRGSTCTSTTAATASSAA